MTSSWTIVIALISFCAISAFELKKISDNFIPLYYGPYQSPPVGGYQHYNQPSNPQASNQQPYNQQPFNQQQANQQPYNQQQFSQQPYSQQPYSQQPYGQQPYSQPYVPPYSPLPFATYVELPDNYYYYMG
ncbi:uncharacterized protein LOC106072264 [Biomphalaria glabrata]|uniref:Uncharacterized protein LOC106072264 n=1 Tax=Biomphalaria glabrata TaxID=6526 RepID=A0A9U8EI22_BIOGL|nr:uncharacterized protein LOC106072264 [Biomphalaria glabrata]XP_055862283.1 uncharacterized protein LOC106072264 [Biomphalaria glabrata]